MEVVNYELKKFIKRLSEFYPLSSEQFENTESILQEYYITINNEIEKTQQEYDFDKLMEIVKKKYSYKTIPTIPIILAALPLAVKQTNMPLPTDVGKKIVVILTKIDKETGKKTKTYQEFIVCAFESANLNMKEKFKYLREKYDDVVVRIFPKGTVIMGRDGKVFNPEKDEVEVLIPDEK